MSKDSPIMLIVAKDLISTSKSETEAEKIIQIKTKLCNKTTSAYE